MFLLHYSWKSLSNVAASLNELEDNDLDALMADLVADLNATEEKFASERVVVKDPEPHPSLPVPTAHFTNAAPPPSQSKAELTRLPSNTSGLTSSTSNTSLPPPPPSNSNLSRVNLSHSHILTRYHEIAPPAHRPELITVIFNTHRTRHELILVSRKSIFNINGIITYTSHVITLKCVFLHVMPWMFDLK